ncbi:hypothetical protein MRX96_035255 [Rhipicephalus microplus]
MRIVNVTGLGQIRRQGDCGRPGSSGPAPPGALELGLTLPPTTRWIEVTSTSGGQPTVNFRLLRPPTARLYFTGLKDLPLYQVIEKSYEQEFARLLQTQLSGPYLTNLGYACRAVPFPNVSVTSLGCWS